MTLNPAGLIAGLDADLGGGRTLLKVILITDSAWRAGRDEAAGWTGVDFDDKSWPSAVDLGPLGTAPWGEIKPRAPFPPLAFGLSDGPRVIYTLDPKPLVLRGLAPGRSYRVVEFDPATGVTRPAGMLGADASGEARREAPAHGHDRVIVLTPEGQP